MTRIGFYNREKLRLSGFKFEEIPKDYDMTIGAAVVDGKLCIPITTEDVITDLYSRLFQPPKEKRRWSMPKFKKLPIHIWRDKFRRAWERKTWRIARYLRPSHIKFLWICRNYGK